MPALCGLCSFKGFCWKLRSKIVTPDELASKALVIDLKRHARDLHVTFGAWPDYLLDVYSAYQGRIVDQSGGEVFLEIEDLFFDHDREWYRDFIGADPAPITFSHIRRAAISRVIVMASILRAASPVKALLWGIHVANDLDPVAVPVNREGRGVCTQWRMLTR